MTGHSLHLSRERATLLRAAVDFTLTSARAEARRMRAGSAERAAAGQMIRGLEDLAAFLPSD